MCPYNNQALGNIIKYFENFSTAKFTMRWVSTKANSCNLSKSFSQHQKRTVVNLTEKITFLFLKEYFFLI